MNRPTTELAGRVGGGAGNAAGATVYHLDHGRRRILPVVPRVNA